MTDTKSSELDHVAADAQAAFAITRQVDASTRARWLDAVAAALDERVDALVALAGEETGLPFARLHGEVARTTDQLRLFGDVIREGSYVEATIDHADLELTPPRPDLRRLLVPIGPVAVFAASNFPFAFSVAGGDTASALAAGCPVIVKAHPGHAKLSRATADIVAGVLRASGAPSGYFALVEGQNAGVRLVQHPSVRAVGFTGSVRGGRALFDLAASRPDPIPFFGELGSVNPVIITSRADAARGAELAAGLAASFQLGAGQFCTKPGVVFVPSGSHLQQHIAEGIGEPAPRLLTDSIRAGYQSGLRDLLAVPGVEVIVGGDPESLVPTVVIADIDALDDHADTLFSEVFGPVVVLIRYQNEAQLPSRLARLEGSLTATLHAEETDDLTAVLPILEDRAGRVLFSGWPTGVAVTWSQHHGGPWPATTSPFTSVGATAIRRFLRPIAFQDAPERVLPDALREDNPLRIPRRVDGLLQLA